MERKDVFLNPFTNFIVTFGLTDIVTQWRAGHWSTAAKNLYTFSWVLDPDIKEKLKTEIELLEQWDSGEKPLAARDKRFVKIVNDIYDALHKKGYFLMAKYNPLQDKDFEALEQEEEPVES